MVRRGVCSSTGDQSAMGSEEGCCCITPTLLPPPSLVHSEYSLLDWPQVTPTRGGRNESHFSKCLQNGSRFARVVPLVEARASVRLCAKGDKIPPWSRMSVSALCTIRSSEALLGDLRLASPSSSLSNSNPFLSSFVHRRHNVRVVFIRGDHYSAARFLSF